MADYKYPDATPVDEPVSKPKKKAAEQIPPRSGNPSAMSVAEFRQNTREGFSNTDLEKAHKQGKTYEKFYEDEFLKGKAKGRLNEAAIKGRRAYELDPPEEVRARLKNAGGGRGFVNPDAGGKKKGGIVKMAHGGSVSHGDGIAQRGKTRGTMC